MEGSGRALGFQGVKDQLNQKFKLMVEGLGNDLYSNMPPHANALWARSLHKFNMGAVAEIRT